MAAVLTLHQGDQEAEYREHPVEVARKALLEAADLEAQTKDFHWAGLMQRFASSLPSRPSIQERSREARKREEDTAERERHDEARSQAERAWKGLAREHREALLFRVLGSDRLLLREMTDRMNAELGFPATAGAPKAVWESEVRNLVSRLFRDGQLGRDAETFNKTHTRYRYRSVAARQSAPVGSQAEFAQMLNNARKEQH